LNVEREVPSLVEELMSEPRDVTLERESSALERLLTECTGRVVIYGAGSTGRRTLACLRSIGVEPLAISDNDPERQRDGVVGAAVLRPEEAAARFGDSALFIVAIWNAQHWYAETARELRKLGCTRVVPISSVYWRFAETFLPFFVIDLPNRVLDERDAVLRASRIWSDEQSSAEYLAHLRWRFQGDFEGLPGRPTHESYFADDIFELSRETLVDCGAYDGDTLASFLKRRGNDFIHIYAIEPSPEACGKLANFVSTLSPDIREKIGIHQIAVGAAPGVAHFDASSGVDSRISDAGTIVVNVEKLDSLCSDFPPTFVKMDIEGGEFGAIRGAEHIIKEARPILAICLEHFQHDLWRLPLLIHDTLPEYKMFLRTYEGDGWQTVVYAVPAERVLPHGPTIK
jgi:FkbM family methyltransferase